MASTDGDDSSSDSSSDSTESDFLGWPQNKKRRKLDDAESTDQDNTTAMLQTCDENNVLPLVDANLTCAACEKRVEKPRKHVVECCSCLRKFHATCKEIEPVGGNRRKLKIMPCKTDIQHFNGIMKHNDAYLGGKFSWTCNSCVTMQSISDKRYVADRLGLIEAMLIKDKSLKSILEDLLEKIKTSSIVPPAPKDYSLATDMEMHDANPPASVAPSYAGVTKATGNNQVTPQGSLSINSSANQVQSRNEIKITRKSQSNKNFRVRITNKSEDSPHISKVLDKLAMQGTLGKYDARSRGKHSMDLLFEDHQKAKLEFEKVKGVLTNLDVHDPELINARKAFLVGLDDYHSPESVHKAIKDEYGMLFEQVGDLNSLKVLEVKPCLKDQTVYRATLSMPAGMLELIESKLNNKLYIGYLRCSVYPYRPHIRCFHCQEHGHMRSRCKNPLRCANCGESHETNTCKSSTTKCINCANSSDHKSGCSSHKADSYNCPIFIQCRKEQTKN